MKISIILAHIVFGAIIIYVSSMYAQSAFNSVTKPDWSKQEFIDKCMLEESASQCESNYVGYERYITNSEHLEINEMNARGARNALSLFITPALLIGILSILSAIGFWNSKKWGAIGLFISNLGILVIALYGSFIILYGGGLSLALLIPLLVITWLVIEMFYIKRRWIEFN